MGRTVAAAISLQDPELRGSKRRSNAFASDNPLGAKGSAGAKAGDVRENCGVAGRREKVNAYLVLMVRQGPGDYVGDFKPIAVRDVPDNLPLWTGAA